MARQYSAVIVYITVNNRMFTAQELGVSEVKITDSDEGDNEIELTIPDDDYKIIDGGLFKVGDLLSVQWGYQGSPLSQQRINYPIMKPSVTYDSDGVVAKVTATTKSATLAARRPQKVSGPTSVKTLVSEIAVRNNLKLHITGGNEKLPAFAHSSLSDREVLQILADRFGYQVSYTSDTIMFAPRDYGVVPALKLVYRRGEESTIISANVEIDARKSLGDNNTVAISVDPKTKTVQQATAQSAPKALAISAENGNTWIAQMAHETDKSTPIPNQTVSFMAKMAKVQLPPEFRTILSTPDSSAENMSALASGEMQKKQKKKGELSITSIGFPEALARMIVRVEGLAKRDSGNWYTLSVEHHIQIDQGYECNWELGRHGANSKGSSDKNTSPLNNLKPAAGDSDHKTKPVVAINAETGKKQ